MALVQPTSGPTSPANNNQPPVYNRERVGLEPPELPWRQGGRMDLSIDDIALSVWADLKGRVAPLVLPAWEEPPLWCKPMTQTKVRFVAPALANQWTDFLSYDIAPGFAVALKSYVATCEGDFPTSGLLYRMRLAKNVITTVQLDKTVEMNKRSATDYPAIPRPILIVTGSTNRGVSVVLQVRNTSGAPVRAIGALYGWAYRERELQGLETGAVDT